MKKFLTIIFIIILIFAICFGVIKIYTPNNRKDNTPSSLSEIDFDKNYIMDGASYDEYILK